MWNVSQVPHNCHWKCDTHLCCYISIGKMKQLLLVQYCFSSVWVYLYYPRRWKSWGFSYKYLLLLHWQGSVSHYHWVQRILWNMDLWLLDYVGLEVISLKHGNISDFSFVKKMFLSIKLSLETECSGSLLSRFPRISRVRPSRKQWPKNAEHGQGAE